MFDIKKTEIEWGGKTLTLETGRVARQADGAVLATLGETVVLCGLTPTSTVPRTSSVAGSISVTTTRAPWPRSESAEPLPTSP